MEKLDEDFGCREQKDDDSVISERCWQENHRGDSRKWLMRDGQKKIPPHRIYSTMRASYSPPEEDVHQYVGKRRALFIKECYEKSYEEAIQDRKKPPPVEEYCTEYDGNYHSPGFEPVPEDVLHSQHEELYQKYPLYGSSAMSFWQHKFERRRDETQPAKFTRVTDPKNPFKRNSTFSTPISEALCSTEW
ncbi:uncharacterized protein LOC123315297 [Coccinella septempunctata]|uniref:uncharacterized protein LOC123315297 n=1 Tax=Coccinella septempunctata TaxID=41139 RepID=UPI001D05D510|nr:uncharacterized protein LOC123315297 [Coccinella septempunctata]